EEEPQLALPWEGLAPTASKAEAGPTDYRLVRSTPELEALLAELAAASSFSVDLEATGKEARTADLVGLSFSAQAGRAYYIPVGHRTLDAGEQLPLAQVLERLGPLLRDPARPKVAHNGKWDMTVLARYGVEIKPLAFDTMIAAYLLGEKALGLKALAFDRLGLEMTPIGDLIGKGSKQITMAQVPVDQAGQYACADADMTLRLRHVLEPDLQRRGVGKLFSEVEMPPVPVLFLMEQSGIALDTPFLRDLSQGLGKEIVTLEAAIYNAVGHQFNINSSPQLGSLLFEELRLHEKLGLAKAKRTKTGYSTDADMLETLKDAHPVVKLLLQYRQVTKLKNTYIDALPALIDPGTGRLHTSFNQTGTATGRLSSSDPNLQNIPIRTEEGRKVRRAFIAPEPCLLLSADYSQIDLRVLAHLSGDPVLTAAFARDEDIHAATASQVFGVPLTQVTPEMRRVAKTVNFGVIYGMSQFGLAQSTDLSREEAGRFIEGYFERYPGVREYLEATKRQAREQGYVQTLLGRRRYIPEINVSNPQARAAAERMAINMPVQGTSADIIKVAMIDTQRQMEARGLRTKILLQVHDELVFEVPPEEVEEMRALVLRTMPRAVELSVPLKVDTKLGRNWAEME
ncbi:MAG: DNA polymerase I, partial [Chloroflexota bacterium]|nr:DNA polymerase I [Chloroflexota bacterium]